MREIAAALQPLLRARTRFALAMVVAAEGSTPRAVGAAMAVTADGRAIGSLSGGCVEGAAYDAAVRVLAGGAPVRERYGSNPDDAFDIGLTCGGVIDVLVWEPDRGLTEALVDALARDEPCAVVTVLGGSAAPGTQLLVTASGTTGSIGDGEMDARAAADARGLVDAAVSAKRDYATCVPGGGQVTALVLPFTTPQRLLVFGATDFTQSLATLGGFLGFRVTVCDARPAFATRQRFPDAAEVVCDWPHRLLAAEIAAGRVDSSTAVVVLTHDLKFDVPLLAVALGSPAGYVGAMGSRSTHESRLAELRTAGLDDGTLTRLRSPIGLDIGGRTPQETAVSIAAELVQWRGGGTGLPLRDLHGPIHHPAAPALVR